MPDKLPDSEIVKALKEVLEVMLSEGDLQRTSTISHTIDLINRLQAENERLKKGWKADIQLTADAKAEAYKEVLNFLENRLVYKVKLTAIGYETAIIDVKNLFKELVGEGGGNK